MFHYQVNLAETGMKIPFPCLETTMVQKRFNGGFPVTSAVTGGKCRLSFRALPGSHNKLATIPRVRACRVRIWPRQDHVSVDRLHPWSMCPLNPEMPNPDLCPSGAAREVRSRHLFPAHVKKRNCPLSSWNIRCDPGPMQPPAENVCWENKYRSGPGLSPGSPCQSKFYSWRRQVCHRHHEISAGA